jgi:outer membrane protein OmpA-like peptidoglycan-associated protein
MARDSLRTSAGWRMYDQANLMVLVLLGLLFLLATQARAPRAPSNAVARVAPASVPAPSAEPVIATAASAVATATAAPQVASDPASSAGPAVASAQPAATATVDVTSPSSTAGPCAAMANGLAGGFVPGKAELSVEGRERLDLLVPCLTGVRYEIAVHTDSRGNQAANLALTEARAKAAAAHLVSRGVPADKLEPRGKGSGEPAASNDTAEGRIANRRLTITPL